MDYVTSRVPAARADRNAWAEPGVEDLGGGLYRIPLPLPGDALTAVNVYAMTGDDGVDLKTGATSPHEAELDRHPQLGVYQLAVLLGAFERLGVIEPGGAELVQVGKAGLTAKAKVQRQRALPDDPDPGWALQLVDAVAEGMAGPVYRARVNPGCRSCPVASCCPVSPDGGQVAP